MVFSLDKTAATSARLDCSTVTRAAGQGFAGCGTASAFGVSVLAAVDVEVVVFLEPVQAAIIKKGMAIKKIRIVFVLIIIQY